MPLFYHLPNNMSGPPLTNTLNKIRLKSWSMLQAGCTVTAPKFHSLYNFECWFQFPNKIHAQEELREFSSQYHSLNY